MPQSFSLSDESSGDIKTSPLDEAKEEKLETKSELSLFATTKGRESIVAAVRKKVESQTTPVDEEKYDSAKGHEFYNNTTHFLKQKQLDKAIEELYLMRDFDLGIDSRYETIDVNDEKVRVFLRDARKQPSPEDRQKDPKRYRQSFYQGWAITGLAFIQASKKLIEHHQNVKNFERLINKLAVYFFEEIYKSSDPEATFLAMMNEVLIPELQYLLPELSDKEIRHQLWMAKEFGNFSRPNCVMATQVAYSYEEKQKTFEELSVCVPVAGQFSKKLDKQYEAIKRIGKEILERQEKGMLEGSEYDWFNNHDFFIQKLIIENIDKIRAGQIPTQLRKVIVGARNLAQTSEFIRGKDNKSESFSEFREKLNFYHMGFPADPKIPDAASDVLEQLHLLTDAKELNIHSMINLVGGKKDEAVIGAQLIAIAQNRKDVNYSNSATQMIGMPAANYLQGGNSVLKKAQIALELKASSSGLEKLQADLLLIKNQYMDMRGKFSLEVEAPSILDVFTDIYANLDNLHFVALEAYMFFLSTQVRLEEAKTAEEKDKIKEELAYFICCMSGKDRTGALREYLSMLSTYHQITEIVPTIDFMKNNLIFNRMSPIAKEIRNKRLASAQASTYAGWASGCSLGSLGTLASHKSGEFSGMYASDSPTLVEKTAGVNKAPPELPSTTKRNIALFIAVIIGGTLLATGIGAVAGVAVLASAAAITMSGLHMSALGLGITAIGVGAGVPAGSFISHKLKSRSAPYFPQARYAKAAFIIALILGAALCGTGIGAIVGVSILAATAVTVAATGGVVGIVAGASTIAASGAVVYNERKKINKIQKVVGKFLSGFQELRKDSTQVVVRLKLKKPTTENDNYSYDGTTFLGLPTISETVSPLSLPTATVISPSGGTVSPKTPPSSDSTTIPSSPDASSSSTSGTPPSPPSPPDASSSAAGKESSSETPILNRPRTISKP